MIRLIFILRALIGVAIFLPLSTVYYSLKFVVIHYHLNNRSAEDQVVHEWCRSILRFFSIRVVSKNAENIPPSGCLFLFNHTSWLDIFSLSYCCPHIRYGAKIELFRIPIFSWALRVSGTLPIKREDRTKVIRVYQGAYEKAQKGQQYALAPEGTRSETEELRPFKSGPFLFAINAQLPIVPVIIKGAAVGWPKKSWIPQTRTWNHQVTIEFLSPVSTNEYGVEHKKELQKKIYQQMVQFF